ncbi:hypothetical protein BD408DRAFT_449511 [Parasitella parasitica]|nr:hypothetical protein BD408DRAFT_449511 [Parasitella parasitica]
MAIINNDCYKREQVPSKFNKWKRSKQAQQYWAHRKNVQDQCNQNNEINIDSCTKATSAASTSPANHSIVSMNRSSSVAESVETITLDEAKSLIRENCVSNSSRNHSSLQKAFFDFKLDTFNSINDSKLLSYESNLQQILALSNILIVKKYVYDAELDNYFKTTSFDSVRKNIFESLKFKFANDLSNGVLTKINALKKVSNTLTEDMDPILVKLLLCFKALVETLPSNTQQKKVKEHELCARYLQPFFQSLFDSNEDDNMLFKWINTITFSCNSNEDQPAATNNRPDGCIENDRETIGYVQVKTIDYATNRQKINVDLHRLGIFGKTALSKYSLNKISK